MITDRVLNALNESKAIVDVDKLIVAVSGGCDSVALLHILANLRRELAVDLHVASLDHGLRGKAGQGDLEFVGELALAWDIPHTLGEVDVPQLSRASGAGIEEAARRARYSFLARVAQQEDCRCVVVGHHANDQAETVLLNIVRGSGLRGLGGMRRVSPLPYHPRLSLIRPLLSVSRAELEAYCREHKLTFRQDESNWDTSYGRNFLRHEVLDMLARLNPEVARALNRLAESAALEEDFLSNQLDSLAKVALRSWNDGCGISRALFREAHPALQRRLLRRAYHRQAAGESLAHDLTRDLAAFCQTAPTGARRDIGAGLQLRVDYEELRILHRGGREPPPDDYRLIPADTDVAIRNAEGLELGGLSICVYADPGACDGGTALVLPARCQLRLRTRRPGDRFKPKGMAGRSRKLKEWMIDRKIPRRIRDRIPLLCADGAIVAICLGAGWRLAELHAPDGTDHSAMVVCLE